MSDPDSAVAHRSRGLREELPPQIRQCSQSSAQQTESGRLRGVPASFHITNFVKDPLMNNVRQQAAFQETLQVAQQRSDAFRKFIGTW